MRTGHGRALSYYDIGHTPFFACAREPRCSYCLYVPEEYDEDAERRYPLVVLVHGTERGAATYRDRFAAFAERHQCIVLAPLFPANLFGPRDLDNYKLLAHGDIRFDLVLLAMVDEVAAKYRIAGRRFLLHGFSGGGHFAHRFLYVHPDRLAAVSIGAPGVVTLLEPQRPWYVGVGGLQAEFGHPLDADALRAVPVQMIVGDRDVDTWEITIPEDSPWHRPGINDAGSTRIERLRSLERSFVRAGIHVEFTLVAGVAHDGWAVLPGVEEFFARRLARPEPSQ